MITNLVVNLQMITPATGGGYAAINFEPDNSSVSSVPSTLADVSQSAHLVVVSPTQTGNMKVPVVDYFGDWRTTSVTGSSDAGTECGVCQFISSNSSGVSAPVAILTIAADVVLTGYRATS